MYFKKEKICIVKVVLFRYEWRELPIYSHKKFEIKC